MSPNRRIALNIVATYGRSLYSLVIGLFCGRWALMALGEVDYGLYGVIGGLTAFIAFFNAVLAGTVSRFYAVAIGKEKSAQDKDGAIQDCRKLFSIAVAIHTVLPVLLMIIGYPIAEWLVNCFLTIPADRVDECLLVLRYVCISCFVSMVCVPYNAMYIAHQYIAELTIYSFATATLNFAFLYYMVAHPGDWLTRYALWSCIIAVSPQLIIAVRAVKLFPECQFRVQFCKDIAILKQLLSFSGWSLFGSAAMLLRNQGVAILVNKYFGPRVNASMAIANSVNGHANTLSGAMNGAFTPAIANAVGAGDYELVRRLSLRVCKYGMMLSYIFICPLMLELPTVMRLWLKNPPQFAIGLCGIMLLIAFIDKITYGHMIAVTAVGKIKWFQIVVGTFNLLALPLAWVFVWMGGNVYYVGWGMAISWGLVVVGRLYYAKAHVNLGIRKWLREVLYPVWISVAISVCVAFVAKLIMDSGFGRLCVTTLIFEICFLATLWIMALSCEEKSVLLNKIRIIKKG